MRQEKALFEQVLKRTSRYLKFTGMDINFNDRDHQRSYLGNIFKRWFYIGNFIWINSAVLSVFALTKTLRVEQFLYMVPCMTFSFLGDMKSFYFLKHEDKVSDIINTLRQLQSIDDFEGKEEVEDEFVKKRLSFLNAANNWLLLMCSMGVATFCVGPLMVIGLQYMATNEIKLFLPFFLWYPFDAYVLRGWVFAYLHQFWAAWIAVFNVYGPDRFFYTSCAFIYNQFSSLQFDMRRISHKSFRDVSSNPQHIQVLIYRHEELIRCIDMLNVIYGKSTLYNVVSSSFIICLCGFNIKFMGNLIMMIPFAAVMFLGSIQIFLFCYYGDMLMQASLEISNSIFNYSQWHELDASSMKCCLLILMRAQKPCKITAFGYRDINLMTFSKILSSAWSYFTLLNSVYSK